MLPVIYQISTNIASAVVDAANSLAKEVYEYSKTVKAEIAEIKKSIPHVHHIVPVGNFSNRDVITRRRIQELHETLSEAGISRYVDPMNLMLVSASTHAALHTDAYIAHVHSYISATDGSTVQVYLMLFALRLEIAAQDAGAQGY